MSGSIAMSNRPRNPRHTTRRSDGIQGRRASDRWSAWTPSRIRVASSARALLLGILASACAATVAAAHDGTTNGPGTYGYARRVTQVQVGDAVPSTPFVDQRGKPFAFAELRGRPAVLSFIYTRCRDARECPLISAKFHTLQERLLGGPVHLVEVTLDPSYDRPRVLAEYGKVFGADPTRWTLATGDADRVLDFAARFDVLGFRDERVGLIHSERTVIVAPSGRIAQMIDETSWSPDEVVAAVQAASGIPSNPLQRLDLWLSAQAVAICGNGVAGFSGLLDLAVVLAIFGVFGWVLYRLARKIFVENA
jgi:cytochrome oxidase Cu insertion factor (SCO1/SenC/PrrC family)